MRILFFHLLVAFTALAGPSFADSHVPIVERIGDADTFDDDFFIPEDPILIVPSHVSGSPDFIAAMEAHTISVLQWQLRTSERILMMVMLLTAAGVVFAGYQLWHAMNARPVKAIKTDAADDTAIAKTPETTSTLSIGEGKFEVTSPIVGILILMIALGSLYFFLTFVYSIEVMPLM